MKEALTFGVVLVALTAFIFAVVYAVFGTMLVYGDLFPKGHSVCVLSHDEEHSGVTYTLCDKRVPR